MSNLFVVLAGPTNETGIAFDTLADLVVVFIVLAGAAVFTSGSSCFVVVLAGAAMVATGNIVIYC